MTLGWPKLDTCKPGTYPVTMNLTALVLATVIGGCGSKPATQSAAVGAAGSLPGGSKPLATAPAATLRASVCVFGCSGPEPVDADGNVYAATYLNIDTATKIERLSLNQFELLDATDAVVAHGTPSAPISVTNGQSALVGRFSGDLAAGSHVRLWVSVRLDAPVSVLKRRPPVRFRLSLAVAGGSPLTATGEVGPSGATG